ncbi:hypothetical protein LG299_00735 [Microbacterium lacus]|uniref:hypothetical protein n=1 Tax=Microbacterium lacus TaxID=415217 RepID=UPI00384C1702
MITRLAGAFAVAALVASALVGCSTPTDPAEPTPLFTSEAQAFAAAEETYRAYVDALNQVDLSDPATFEPVFALTTGEANAEFRATFSQMHADEWVVAGDSRASLVEPVEWSNAERLITLAICLDVSQVTLTDADGISMVSADRPDTQSMLVSLVTVPSSATGFAITTFESRQGSPECD